MKVNNMAARWHSKAVAQFFRHKISEKLPVAIISRAYRKILTATARKISENCRREQNPGHIEKFLLPLPGNFLRIEASYKIPGI